MATKIGKRFNWVRSPTAWESAQAWKNIRSQAAAKFEQERTAAVNGFLTAQNSYTSGLVTNAAQAAVSRLNATKVNTVA
jgi:hypothetical protein